LIDGVRYEDSRSSNAKNYDPRQQFTRFYFKETETKFNMDAFEMKRTDENLFKQHHQMLNLKQLKLKSDTNLMQLDSMSKQTATELKHNLLFTSRYYNEGNTTRAKVKIDSDILDYIPESSRRGVVSNA